MQMNQNEYKLWLILPNKSPSVENGENQDILTLLTKSISFQTTENLKLFVEDSLNLCLQSPGRMQEKSAQSDQ